MDKDDVKRLKGQALAEARVRTGAKKHQIDLTDKEWEAELTRIKSELSLVEETDPGHLLDSAESLLTITEKMLSISQQVEKLYVYASMKNDQDTREAKYQEYQSKATALYVKFGEVYAFYEPEFLKISTRCGLICSLQAIRCISRWLNSMNAPRTHLCCSCDATCTPNSCWTC